MLNVRASDIEYNPMAISYLLVGEDYVNWYVLKEEVEDPQSLDTFDVLGQEGISILPYDSIALTLAGMEDQRL